MISSLKLANVLFKGSGSKYFRVWESHSLCHNYSTLLFCKNSPDNKWMRGHSSVPTSLLFIKTGRGPGLADGLDLADLCSRWNKELIDISPCKWLHWFIRYNLNALTWATIEQLKLLFASCLCFPRSSQFQVMCLRFGDQIHPPASHKTGIKIKPGTSFCNKRTDILRQTNLEPPS